ncbi:MAG TPA: ATP-binding protein [Solirubrobacteraceae bacterium]|nr:ATP-binding protein [Solirubrobacteraceae bacterium]
MARGSGTPTNPFRFGALALDEAFTDREDEIRELAADVRNGQDVVLFAPRRYGKSSLIWRVAQQLVGEGVLVAQVDLMRTPTKEKLAEKLAKTIHDEIASPLFRARERLRMFAGLRIAPTATIDPEDGSLSFSFDARAGHADLDATLEGLLALPGRLAAERGRRVALVLDEFQEVVEIDSGLLKLMRSVFQEQPEVAHVYLGSARHMIERIFNDEHEPFWRSAKQRELGAIPRAPFEHYAVAAFARTEKELDAQVCAAVLDVTHGHPYATQELLYFLWEETPVGEAATSDRLARALTSTLRSEHAHFSLLWSRAAAAQRRVLQALAAEQPGRPLSGEYRRRHSLPVAATVQTALAALSAAELVIRIGRGEYRIAEPFLAEWIELNES